jgi:cytochrome c553
MVRMSKKILSLIALCLIAVAASSRQGQQQTITPTQIMLRSCVQCHDFKVITIQRKSEEKWRLTVNDMIGRGAPVLPGEAETLIRHLAESYGLNSSPTQVKEDSSLEQYLPAGEGRKLVLGACTKCHGLQELVSFRRPRAEWSLNIRQMVKLGARLTAEEIVTAEIYLSQSFGPDAIPEGLQSQGKGKGDQNEKQ